MMLEEVCLKTHEKFGKGRFTSAQFASLHGISIPSAKVLIHRLGKSGQALRAGRGEYVLVSPANFMKLEELERKKGKLHPLAMELFRMFPELSALVLYGSQVRGDADEYSDYDVLLILPEKNVETAEVREKIGKMLGIKLHLTIYSERGYGNAVLSEPYLRFWLAEGVVLDESGVLRAPFPPVPKMAYEEWVSTAQAYMENAGETKSPGKKCRYYFTALEILECVKEALQMRYDFGPVKSRLEELIGKEKMQEMRSGAHLERGTAALLGRVCKKELGDIASALKCLGDNEADIYWKKKLAEGVA